MKTRRGIGLSDIDEVGQSFPIQKKELIDTLLFRDLLDIGPVTAKLCVLAIIGRSR
jgi:hypothetical protein